MLDKELMEQARYIFTTGKMIQDYFFKLIARHSASESKKNGCHELSMSQFHVIKIIHNRDQVTITELSQILNVSPPSASAMVDRLVERGLLIRERSKEDRRKVVVSMSSELVEEFKLFEEKLLKSFMGVVEKVGSETARKWCEVLSVVKKVLEEER